ncbi:MAG: hypothetical protein HQL28_05545, partial [Candidatus Omnitrophica bacterium]|nr:hypothetical protein [Candidatus Omnitrophota bacterium]
ANGEKAAYVVAETVKKHHTEIAARKYAYIAPKELYARGDKAPKGSDKNGRLYNVNDEKAFMDESLGKDVFHIETYAATAGSAEVAAAILTQVKNAKREGRIPVIALTSELREKLASDGVFSELKNYITGEETGKGVWLAQPFDNGIFKLVGDHPEARAFIREAEGAAMLQTLLTAKGVQEFVGGAQNTSSDVAGVVTQMAGQSLENKEALYLLLPYIELNAIDATVKTDIQKVLAIDNLGDLTLVAKYIISKLPICMKIVATGVMQQLDNRRHVQWSA